MGLYKLWKVKQKAKRAVDKFEFVVKNLRREKGGQSRILTNCEKIKKFFAFIYPPWKREIGTGFYDKMFKSGTRQYKFGILIRNIFMIEIFGIVMYLLLSFKYSQLPEALGTWISVVIHVFLMFTLIFPKMMSYFMIAIHIMISTKIKNVIIILIVTIAFEGPAMNVIRNFHQVASGVACIQVDVMSSKNDVEGNIMDKGEMMVSRFRTVFKNIAGPMNSVKRMLLVLDEKATKFIDIMRKHFHTVADLSNKCRRLLQTPYVKCIDIFDDAYNLCKTRIRFFGSYEDHCSMIQKTAIICQQSRGIASEVCSFPTHMSKTVRGAAIPFYSAYFHAIEFAVKKIFFVHIEAAKWALNKVKPVVSEIRKTAKVRASYVSDSQKPNAADDSTANLRQSIKKSLLKIVNFYVAIINTVSLFLRFFVMPAFLIYPFIYTFWFIYNYNYNDEYKNNFLTDEFEKIDRDCAFRNVRKVLPLTTDEQKSFTKRDAWRMTIDEIPKFRLDLFITVISCFTPFFVCLLDVGVYTILKNVYIFMSRTNIESPAHYELKISGNGSMSNIVSELVDVFSPFTTNIRQRESRWRQCFRQPDPPNYGEHSLMLFMFFVAIFLCRLKAFLWRQSLVLADHFWPLRVRIRALNLYYRILKSRRNVLAEMLGVNETDIFGGSDVIARQSIQNRGYVCSECAKCEKYDLRIADQENVRICVNCGTFYCIDCFCVTLNCLKCDENMQIINGIELFYEEDGEEGDFDSSNSSKSNEEKTSLSSINENNV